MSILDSILCAPLGINKYVYICPNEAGKGFKDIFMDYYHWTVLTGEQFIQ